MKKVSLRVLAEQDLTNIWHYSFQTWGEAQADLNGTKLSPFGINFFVPGNTTFVLSLSKRALRQAQDERYLRPSLADQDLLNDQAGGDRALCEQTLNTLNLVAFQADLYFDQLSNAIEALQSTPLMGREHQEF